MAKGTTTKILVAFVAVGLKLSPVTQMVLNSTALENVNARE
jgi:hypothetical protein